MHAEWFVESMLADRLGVTRGALEEFRSHALKKSVDWKRQNRQVLLSEPAVKKILRQLHSPDLDYSGCAEKNGEHPTPMILELTVTRVFLNPRLIQAATSTGEQVLVWVSKNNNFRPRMTVKAHPPGPQPAPQIYRLEGRCPRFPGRW